MDEDGGPAGADEAAPMAVAAVAETAKNEAPTSSSGAKDGVAPTGERFFTDMLLFLLVVAYRPLRSS